MLWIPLNHCVLLHSGFPVPGTPVQYPKYFCHSGLMMEGTSIKWLPSTSPLPSNFFQLSYLETWGFIHLGLQQFNEVCQIISSDKRAWKGKWFYNDGSISITLQEQHLKLLRGFRSRLYLMSLFRRPISAEQRSWKRQWKRFTMKIWVRCFCTTPPTPQFHINPFSFDSTQIKGFPMANL